MVIIIVLVTSHHITSHDCNDPHYPDPHHTLTSLHLHKARPPLPRAAVEDRGRSWHCRTANYQTSATVGLDSIVDIPSSTSSLSLFSLACLSVFAIVVMIIVFAILIIAKKEEPTLNKARNQVAVKRSGNPTLSTENIQTAAWRLLNLFRVGRSTPVLKIEFGPPPADLGSIWFPRTAYKFQHMQQTTKMGILWQCQFYTNFST